MTVPYEKLKQETDRNQARASDPRVSAWVSANAGTGKTLVLVNRVLRLLLHRDGEDDAYTRPEKILCLTYTKAAAGEMEIRLFKILSEWAVMEEAKLAGALKELRGEPATDEDMIRARHLFAIALDTKGGLKIHTIHAFCERLLHRFPLEAQVQAGFDVLEDAERHALREAAIDEVLGQAAAQPGEPLGQALMEVVAAAGEESFRGLIGVTLGKQEELRAMTRLADAFDTLGDAERSWIARALKADAKRRDSDIWKDMANALSDAQINAVLTNIPPDKKTEQSLLSALGKARAATFPELRAQALYDAFLTKAGTARKSLLTKSVREAHPEIDAVLCDARDTVAALAREQAALNIASATGALLTLADEIIQAYE
ncbi:MAG: UvrD-helicase domain-containing protein, partial [Methyloligellaceae bacterium]